MVPTRRLSTTYCSMSSPRTLWYTKSNKIGRDDTSLMKQLVEWMLSIGAWFTEENFACLIYKWFSINRYSFAVAFHCHLLNVSSKAQQSLHTPIKNLNVVCIITPELNVMVHRHKDTINIAPRTYLAIRKYSNRTVAKVGGIPNANETHHNRDIMFHWSWFEMKIYRTTS